MRLLLDCDPGVDDALAIAMAVATKNIDLELITTVDGNVGIDQVTRNAVAVLEACDALVPVHRGASQPLAGPAASGSRSHGSDGLGNAGYEPTRQVPETEDAIEAMLELVNGSPGEITVAAVGPLTNIASAVRADPDFARNVKQLVIMGGAEGPGNVSPSAEFNFRHDPLAARDVFTAGFANVVVVGLDVTSKVFLTPTLRELLWQHGGNVARFAHAITRAYVDMYWRLYRVPGSELCDPLVIGYLLQPELFTLTDAEVEIDTEGISAGRSLIWRQSRFADRLPNAKFATDVDAREFLRTFLRHLAPGFIAEIDSVLEHEYLPRIYQSS